MNIERDEFMRNFVDLWNQYGDWTVTRHPDDATRYMTFEGFMYWMHSEYKKMQEQSGKEQV